jgi:hypothetical protein
MLNSSSNQLDAAKAMVVAVAFSFMQVSWQRSP